MTTLNFAYIWQMLFTASLYAVLSGFALGFHWFAPGPAAWGTFTLIFFVFFGLLTAIFELYFCMTGIRYNRRLEAYKAEQGR